MKDLNFTIVVHTITICIYAKKCGSLHLKKKFMSCLMYKNIVVKGLYLRISYIIHTCYINYIFVT